jgi:hypothetical protein
MVRKVVPQETQASVLAASRRRCAICFGLHGDRGTKAGQIAHLDRDAANSSFENLVFLCLEHHDLFDTRTSQSKGLTPHEVRRYREELTAAIERGEFGPGASLGGGPTPEPVTDRDLPALAPERPTIPENSAAEILSNLNGITLDYEFRARVEELYRGRWTRDPGWRVTLASLPSKLPSGAWFCGFLEVGSATIVSASTGQDVSALRRGDSVTVSGKISEVSRLGSIHLQNATIVGDESRAALDHESE